jgi:hypothetical protein
MDKLLESYKSLAHLGTQVLFFIEVHQTYSENENVLNQIKFKGHYANIPLAKGISGSLLNYAIIIANSFFDEYNEEFTSSKHPTYKDRINRLKKITKPVLKRLNKWTNFKDYRNYILAHSFRFKDTSIFDKDFKPFKFNAPHTNSEIILLAELMRIVTTCIAQEFPELLVQMNSKENILSKIDFEWNEVDIDKELENIWTQINSIKEQI